MMYTYSSATLRFAARAVEHRLTTPYALHCPFVGYNTVVEFNCSSYSVTVRLFNLFYRSTLNVDNVRVF